MPKKESLQDVSVDDLRWLLLEKRRAARHDRLEHYRRTGRVVQVAPDVTSSSLETWRSGLLADEAGERSSGGRSRSAGRRVLDGLLLLVEVGAVLGFLFILFNGLNVIRELNQEAQAMLVQPTLTPTPLVVAVVLPSGHTPPNAKGGARFNDAEIPEHLRPLMQSLASVPPPAAAPEQAIRIQVDRIRVDAPVVQGDGWEQLKKGVGQHVGTVNPGQNGNVVLSAHNDIFGEIFRDLDQLQPGDSIVLYTNQRAYTYLVVDTQVVEPNDVHVMESTAQPTVTLISCYPYMKDNQRIVVTGRLQGNN